jgi:DNA relaxase NicK
MPATPDTRFKVPAGRFTHEPSALGVTPAVAEAFVAAQHARKCGLSPLGNTGMDVSAGSALVDYVKFTVRGLKKVAERVSPKGRDGDGLDEVRAVLYSIRDDEFSTAREAVGADDVLRLLTDSERSPTFDPLQGERLERVLYVMATIVLATFAPAIVVGQLTGRGREGYKNHAPLYTHLGERCGSILCGGNANTVHFDLTGVACRRVDWDAFAATLGGLDFRITRLDAAWDHTGEGYTPRGAFDHYRAGGFKPAQGPRTSKALLHDDAGTGAGCTFSLGSRETDLVRFYDWGAKHLGQPEKVYRIERQCMGSVFEITLDHVRDPASVLLAYPDLGGLPIVSASGLRLKRIRETTEGEEIEAALESAVRHVNRSCGAALAMLSAALGDELTVELLRADDAERVPSRFRKFGDTRDELSEKLAVTAKKLRGAASAARLS